MGLPESSGASGGTLPALVIRLIDANVALAVLSRPRSRTPFASVIVGTRTITTASGAATCGGTHRRSHPVTRRTSQPSRRRTDTTTTKTATESSRICSQAYESGGGSPVSSWIRRCQT